MTPLCSATYQEVAQLRINGSADAAEKLGSGDDLS
jgi:hypothetical protein